MAQLRIKAGRHTVEVSKPDKVLFPDDGIAKADLAEYYHQVANRMLPYLRGRPLALERYPDGISHQRVFQKDVPSHFPEWVTRVDVERVKGGTVRQAVADKAAALVYLADQGCVTPHAFLSRHDRLNQPDQLIFDLDPPEGDFEAARRGALTLRGLLCDELGLAAYPKTTGGKGVHVMSPLVRGWGFDRVREFARDAADLLVDRFPDEITTEQRKDKRGGRLFIDVLRNAYAQTAVPPYAVRARKGAPVAMPLSWEEVADSSLAPDRFTVRNAVGRIVDGEDPWSQLRRRARGLSRARRRLDSLLKSVARG